MDNVPDNVKPWQFQPGNPGGPGRPRAGATFKDIIHWSMCLSIKDGDQHKTQKQFIVEKVTEMARQGKEWAIEWLADRLEGKAVQTVIEEKKNPLKDLSDEQLEEALAFIKARKIPEQASGKKPAETT